MGGADDLLSCSESRTDAKTAANLIWLRKVTMLATRYGQCAQMSRVIVVIYSEEEG